MMAMKLHNLISVTATAEPDVYLAVVDITDANDERYEAEHISRAGDPYGLGPAVRAAIDQWIADSKPVLPYVEPPPPVPGVISRRQFYQGLAVTGKISQAEALAAIKTATLPAALQTMLDGMTDEGAKFEADMLLSGASDFNRSHPLIMVIAITQSMTEQDVDDFWRLCAAL